MKGLWGKILKPSRGVVKWLIFITLLVILALNSMDQFQPLRDVLDNETFSLTIGESQFSAYRLLNIALTIAVLIWIIALASDFAEAQLGRMHGMRASTRELTVKLSQIGIYVVGTLVALDLIGLDLTMLTVFGGAVGIGIGFGLQKIASNFISGLILLMEKSIEVGDLVELSDNIYGFIRHIGARYTLLETFDSKEILIPNEDFITNRVTNWTFSDHNARVEIPVGVAYGSDLEKVRDVLLEAAREHPRCAQEPQPTCFLRSFGDSSINFTLFFWVNDVENGRWAPQSEVMFAIWRKFGENKVTIPFPQRDLHFKSPIPTAAGDSNTDSADKP